MKMLKSIQPGAFFCLFPKRHQDLYCELRRQLTGDLSTVFTRLAFAGKTLIRPHEFSNSEIVRCIKGYDANSLYLHALQKPNPCGYFVRHRELNNFRPDPCSRHELSAFQWLS